MHCSEQKTRPLGQAVKTPPFHGGNRGSIPLGVTICGYRISVILQPSKLERWVRFPLPAPSNACLAQLGEHLPYKQRVTGSIPVVSTNNGSVAQLVRVPACHAGGRGFEPLLSRQFYKKLNVNK